MADTMTSYTPALSDEVYLIILEALQHSSPRSMLNVCLASRRLCRLATSIIYHSVQTPYGSFRSRNHDPTNTGYTFENNVVAHCRTLVVTELLNWNIFATVLSRMGHLDELCWRYWLMPFPSAVKDVLRSLPRTKLKVERLAVGSRDDEDVQENDRTRLQTLVGIPNIHSVKAEIFYEHPEAMRWLKDVLLSSSNLEVLHLTLPRNFLGSAQWSNDSIGTYDLCAQPGEQLSSLKELVYESRMCWGDDPFLIPTSFFNWSSIRHLTLRGHRMICMVTYLVTHQLYLTSLTIEYFCVGIDYEYGGQLLNDFISGIQGLQSLTLVNPVKQLPISTLAIHSRTLKELNIQSPRRGSEPYSIMYKPRPYLPTDLDEMRLACPHLETLSIDISFTKFLPYDVLAALARFPKLNTLRLFEVDGRWQENPSLPHYRTDLLTVHHVYSYISSRKIGVLFDTVNFMLGDYPLIIGLGGIPTTGDRPNMWFCCREVHGELIVEDDFKGTEDLAWTSYFDDKRLDYTPGQTFPSNPEEIFVAEAEADTTLNLAANALPHENSTEMELTAPITGSLAQVDALFDD